MEAWTRSLRRAATWRRRPGLGGTAGRKPSWPLAAKQQPSALPLAAKRLLQITRPDFRRRAATCIIHRTAVYGPVRTVVWEGRSREAPPYPVLHRSHLAQRNMRLAPLSISDCQKTVVDLKRKNWKLRPQRSFSRAQETDDSIQSRKFPHEKFSIWHFCRHCPARRCFRIGGRRPQNLLCSEKLGSVGDQAPAMDAA